jgi:peptidoglycan/LPS O-acetylase OafA/YrhL
VRFPGFDSLRAYAALFVVLGHIPMTQASRGLPAPHGGALFYRGSYAVSFFFTLSGFLITYLLLTERERSGTVDLKAFYLRRVLRIWPLYFATIAGGLVVYKLVLPSVGIVYPVDYTLPVALLLYVFFLPNLMNSLFTVGGLLNPTWSIGIEEQFYLAWAPVVRRWGGRLPWVCGLVGVGSFAAYVATQGPWGLTGWAQKFTGQLKFHFMAAGALAAWAFHTHRERLLALPVFRRAGLQWALGLFLLQFYLVDLVPLPWPGQELVQLLLYPWLLLEVGANPARRLPLANPFAERLGEISYGLYMLHMFAVYAVAFLFENTVWWEDASLWLYSLAFYGLAFSLTWLLSYLSFRFWERPFLGLKERLAR